MGRMPDDRWPESFFRHPASVPFAMLDSIGSRPGRSLVLGDRTRGIDDVLAAPVLGVRHPDRAVVPARLAHGALARRAARARRPGPRRPADVPRPPDRPRRTGPHGLEAVRLRA